VTDALQTWLAHVEHVLADRFLTAEEEAHLRAVQYQVGLAEEDIAPYVPRILRAKSISAALAGPAPYVVVPNLLLREGEFAQYYFAARWCTKVTQREYQSAHRGTSVRVARGVRFTVGGSRGRWVETAHAAHVDGALVVTNRNVWFLNPHVPLTMPLRSLIWFDYAENGVAIHLQDIVTDGFFAVSDGEYVAAAIYGARQRWEAAAAQDEYAWQAAAPTSGRAGTARDLRKGMTRDEVIAAVGEPDDVDERVTKKKTKHVLKYRDYVATSRFRLRVTLEDGVVVGWSGEV
jgi:hypothetical protein